MWTDSVRSGVFKNPVKCSLGGVFGESKGGTRLKTDIGIYTKGRDLEGDLSYKSPGNSKNYRCEMVKWLESVRAFGNWSQRRSNPGRDDVKRSR